jgi:hypothetical protein
LAIASHMETSALFIPSAWSSTMPLSACTIDPWKLETDQESGKINKGRK